LVRVESLGNGSWDLSFDVTEVDLGMGRRWWRQNRDWRIDRKNLRDSFSLRLAKESKSAVMS